VGDWKSSGNKQTKKQSNEQYEEMEEQQKAVVVEVPARGYNTWRARRSILHGWMINYKQGRVRLLALNTSAVTQLLG